MRRHGALADQRPLQMLNREHLQDFNAIRHYLLDKTQHMIGGFGKLPGDVPGPYSSIAPELERFCLTSPTSRHPALQSRSRYTSDHT